jgi:signal transduction histidine kinase
VSSEQRQLRVHRTLLLTAGTTYLVWWAFVRAFLPNAFNPLPSRIAVAACFFAVVLASYVSNAIARTLAGWLAVCAGLLTAHYFYLFDRNGADLNWVVGSYITVTAVCAILQTSRTLLLYSLFVALLSAAILSRHRGDAYVVFLPGMLTSLLFANIGLRLRFKLLARLQESVAQQSRAEAELVRANRDLEAFSYSVAHDLRTPLRGINGFSRILLEDYASKLDEEGSRHLDRIAAAAETMGLLIDALLKLARVTRRELERETIDLGETALAVVRDLREADRERRVDFEVQPGLVDRGDRQLLRVLLENLIGNAWKFTQRQPSARVVFGAKVEDGIPIYYVEDNGAGFDMTYAAKLFGPFRRLHAADDFPGTGIGLATVQRIVDRHGGRVWAEGAVNQGATFYFTLQAHPSAAPGPSTSS